MKRLANLLLGMSAAIFVLLGVAYFSLNLLLYAFVRITPFPDAYLWHPFLTTVHRAGIVVERNDYPRDDSQTGKVTYDGHFVARWNERGFRDGPFGPRRAGVTRIALVGGSATVTGSTNEATFESLAEAKLRERGRPVEIYNFGLVGRGSTRELFVLASEAVRYDPDFLLVYDGRNDAFFASMPEYVPFWNPYDRYIVSVLNGDAGYWLPLYRVYTRFFDRPPNLFYRDWPRTDLRYSAHKEIAEVYADNLASMLDLARGRGMGAMVVLQPSIIWSDEKPLAPFERRLRQALNPTWVAAMRSLKPRIAQAARRATGERSVVFADFTDVFDGVTERMYNDDVHQTDRGNELIADRLVEILEKLLDQAPAGASFSVRAGPR